MRSFQCAVALAGFLFAGSANAALFCIPGGIFPEKNMWVSFGSCGRGDCVSLRHVSMRFDQRRQMFCSEVSGASPDRRYSFPERRGDRTAKRYYGRWVSHGEVHFSARPRGRSPR